jgi:hypothetical protein
MADLNTNGMYANEVYRLQYNTLLLMVYTDFITGKQTKAATYFIITETDGLRPSQLNTHLRTFGEDDINVVLDHEILGRSSFKDWDKQEHWETLQKFFRKALQRHEENLDAWESRRT